MKLLLILYCGTGGHRAEDSACSILEEAYSWESMSEDCKVFVSKSLHCLTGKPSHKIPRPLSLAIHGRRPNEMIHFDFLHTGAGICNIICIFVIRDDLSSYLWLVAAEARDAETDAQELERWIRVFTVMEVWVSYQGSHFQNEVKKELAQEHKIKHRFTV